MLIENVLHKLDETFHPGMPKLDQQTQLYFRLCNGIIQKRTVQKVITLLVSFCEIQDFNLTISAHISCVLVLK